MNDFHAQKAINANRAFQRLMLVIRRLKLSTFIHYYLVGEKLYNRYFWHKNR